MQIFIAVVVLGCMGLLFGVILSIASKLFDVREDERIEKVVGALPGANCGACGFAGCHDYAVAVVSGEAKTNLCSVGGSTIAVNIADIMGVATEKVERFRAQVMCSGDCEMAPTKFDYSGVEGCVAISQIHGGDMKCQYGCLGHGTCVSRCPFNAISIVDKVARVDYDKCQACGICVAACPKKVIKLVPFDTHIWVGCSSKDTAVKTRENCNAGCIGCKICEKTCPVQAITVNESLASIDYEKCISCGKCTDACPRKIIYREGIRPVVAPATKKEDKVKKFKEQIINEDL